MEQTVIQVMDQKATSLEIEKQVIGDNQNETFKFTVMFQDAVSKKYSATIYNADGSKQKDITTSYGILNAELKQPFFRFRALVRCSGFSLRFSHFPAHTLSSRGET